jgi:hypothetical protein
MLEVFKEANAKSTEKKEDPLSPLQKEEVLFSSSSSVCQLYDAAKVAIIHTKI